MLGHGQSNNDKELLGYFGDKDGYKNILADAKTLTDIAKKEYPDKKFIIAGHSMGSLVMRCYINEYGNDFDGAVFIGTAGPTPIAKAGIPIMKVVAALKGKNITASSSTIFRSALTISRLNTELTTIGV